MAAPSQRLVFLRGERLNVPVRLNLGKRVRITCIDASRDVLAFGTNTGNVYFYNRTGAAGLSLLKMLTVQSSDSRSQDAVTCLRLRCIADLAAACRKLLT